MQPAGGVGTAIGEEEPTQEEVIPANAEVKKCIFTKGGRCKHNGEGARKVPVMSKVPVVGADGVKTTKSVKKYVWKCDINRQGRKMTQTSLSSFLRVRSPEMTAGVGNTTSLTISQSGNSFDDSVGQQQHSVERETQGEVQ